MESNLLVSDVPKILLVNDHLPTLAALETILQEGANAGLYEIVSAESGEEALRQVLAQQFAVILLDVSMPGMDGFETAELIHSRSRSASIPIIFITAYYADEMNRLKGYALGAVDFLITPVIPQILQSKVSVFVDLARKNLELQSTTRELEALNQSLVVRQMQELRVHNEALQLEIVERRQAEQRAHELATRDALTGMLNRRSLIEGLEHAVVSARHHGELLAVLFLDMDRFKAINDTLGHDVGDQLLVQAAQRIVSAVREQDLVARLGGDEFVIVVRAMANYGDAGRIAHNILAATGAEYQLGSHAVKSSTSIGISLFPQDSDSAHGLIKKADLAMYHSKKEKRGQVYFYSAQLDLPVLARMHLERELQQALERNELELFYQPKVRVDSGRIAGLEALLRWRHPQRGLLCGSDFIDTALESGLVVELGDWVITTACAQIRQWQEEGSEFGGVPLAVNLAIPQIRSELPAQLRRQLLSLDIAPSSLQLEITESLLIRDIERTAAVLQEISASGITIAIDDFGTGYSSLSMLKALPIDILKIDQSFVRQLEQDANDRAIVAAIIHMAHALGLKVVAEGVESELQLAILAELRCDKYQGFLYSEPLSASDLALHVASKAGRPSRRVVA